MEIISAVLPVIIIIVIFFLVVRIATAVLKLTGMDEKTARFQAISAFTGTGFTTKEAETILEDQMRRKTISVLMILGKVGIVSVIAGLFFSFGKGDVVTDVWKAIILLIFIFILYKLTSLKSFSRALNKFIEKRIVARGITQQKTLEELFHLPKGYGLAQLTVVEGSKENGLSLAEAGFIKKDILVLSIERKNRLISFPHAQDLIKEGDRLLCYGLIKNIKVYAA
ncbi:MAG: hypothetical protein K9L86_01395 [Candidatus Omnitrophica bacterium]|nr:hypothetical protein [Candidatus Omnitrophota bacterium]